MKIWNIVIAVAVVVGFSTAALAQDDAADSGPYEKQLRNYSRTHDEFSNKWRKENEKRDEEAQQLRMTEMELRHEYKSLQGNIKDKESGIIRLKDLNGKMQKAQVIMQEQYTELEGLFQGQQLENYKLKAELEESKTGFYKKMIQVYQEEDSILSQKIETLQQRQEIIQQKIAELEGNLNMEKDDKEVVEIEGVESDEGM